MGVKAKTSLPSKQADSRLGQKFGIMGDELNYTLTPVSVKRQEKVAVSEGEDLLVTLQKIYDLFEVEAGMKRDIKDKIARVLANYYHQEEPGFTADEAYKSIVRDYQMVKDIPERSKTKPKQPKNQNGNTGMPIMSREKPSPKIAAAAEPKAPTIQEIMAGRPFSPADFMDNKQPAARQMPRTPQPNVNRNSVPAMMPPQRPRMGGARPPMMGSRPAPYRGMNFGFMGFPMMSGRPW